MAGTHTGGRKAALANKSNDPSFYKRIGALGGSKGRTGGFYANRALASSAGRKGGAISRRGKTKQPTSV